MEPSPQLADLTITLSLKHSELDQDERPEIEFKLITAEKKRLKRMLLGRYMNKLIYN